MAKQLNVNLNFTADTSQAQRNLMELSKTLNSIANTTPINNLGLSKEMQAAKASAKELQQHISNAFNTKTGNLDLNKLNASLQSSGQSLGTLSANLLKAGTTGEQAFMNIQKAISTASVQINQTNGLLAEFWTTLKNTTRWQISSSILHGFMGALQSAWGYAKDLDKSLNDIRIVTGYNTEKMAKFAEQANKAAKALSTTTTSYTNASLIYYQQGLNEKEVLERTNITVKMANVAGKSAAEVSDQLTAVWNNFYDGSKSLEYYADVMTALGAATASSTDEIAEGLEKFAAVAETVGLSYEYATAALATVTAETRQSADVVGTAFKTLFARLQDLELGKTLDDGTTLGKYSAALKTVGINIKDTNGELKDMDQILDELGNKWTNLSKDTQVALAQTVAGTRQYTQLVALMDNWDVFQTNLGTVDASEGALTTQAEIYAESWEAATARVQATAQGIYKDLFPTEDLIELANGFAVFLEGVDGVVEGLGGIKGILLLISTIALNAFQNQIGGAIQSVISKVSSLSAITLNLRKSWTGVVSSTAQLNSNLQQVAAAGGSVEKQAKLYKDNLESSATSATKLTQEMITTANSGKIMSNSISTYTSGMSQINNLQILIENSSRHLTSEQKEQLSLLQQQAIAANEQSAAAQASLEAVKKRQEISLNTTSAGLEDADKYEFMSAPGATEADSFGFISDEVATKTRETNAQNLLKLYGEQDLILTKHNNHIAILVEDEEKLQQLNIDSKKAYSDIYTANLRIKDVKNQIAKSGKNDSETQERQKKAYQDILSNLKQQDGFTGKIIKAEIERVKATKQGDAAWDESKLTVQEIESIIQKATSATGTMAKVSGTTAAEMQTIETHAGEIVIAEQQAAMQAENFKNKIDSVSVGLQNALQSAMDTGHIISGMASGLSTVAMGINSISNAWNTLNNEEATFVEKLSAGAMGATMGISALMTVMKGAGNIINSVRAATELKNAADLTSKVVTGDATQAELENLLVTKLGVAEDQKAAAAEAMVSVAQQGGTASTIKDTAANWTNVASQAAKLWYVTLIVAAVAALVAITVALVTAESKEEKQAKRSAKAAEEMKESADEAAESLNNIKSAFDAYDTAVAKLKECREGTEEWNKALQEVNSTVLKILQDVPELAANADLFVRDPKTGMLTINESEKANVLAAAEQKANTTAALSVVANSVATVDRMASVAKDLEQEIGNYKGVGQYNYDTESYTDYIDLGKILTDNAADLAGLAETEYRNKVNELLKDAASDMAKSYSGFDEQINTLVDSAVSYQSQINTLATNTEAAAQQMRTAFQLLTDQNLGNSYDGAEKSMAAVQLEKRTKELKSFYYNKMTGSGISKASGANNAIYKEIANKLADATNNEYVAATGNTVLGTDTNRRFIFDRGGDRVEKSATWVARQIAAAEALKELNKSANDASKALENMDVRIASVSKGFASNETAETAMRGFIASQNFEGLSIGDLTTFQKEVAQFNPDGISTGNASKADIGWYLDKIFDDGKDGTIDDITAEKYGFKNTQDMIDTFYNQLSAKYKLIESLTIDEAGLIDFNKLSEKAAIAFDNAYKQMNLGPLGEKAGETFVNGINDILNIKKLDPDKQVEALEKLSEIDWSAYDSLEKVQAIMAGFNVDLDIVQWKEFAETMRIAYNATPDYAKIKTELKSIGAIIADIEFGSIVKEEDFEVLAKYSAAWRDLFILQADGTRKFIGNAKDMKKAMQTSIRESGEDLLKKEKYATAIKNAGVKTSFTESEVEKAAGGDGKDGLFRFAAEDRSTSILKELGWNVDSDGRIWKKSPGSRGNEQTISQEEASRRVMNYQRAEMASELINTSEIQDALMNQGYSQETLDEIIQEAREGNTERLNVLMNGLDSLVGQDYEQLNKDFQQMLASTATSFGELNQMLANDEIGLDVYEQQVLSLTQEQLSLAESISDLETAWKSALATGIEIDYDVYSENLLRLANEYTNCTFEIDKFETALASGNQTAVVFAQEQLEIAIMLGEAAEKYGVSAEEMEIQASQMAKTYGISAKAAAKMAIENQRMNEGVSELAKNWSAWKDELSKSDKTTTDYAKAAAALTKTVAKLVGASEDLELSPEFLETPNNLKLIEKAAEGDIDAINELGLAVAADTIKLIELDAAITRTLENGTTKEITLTQFENAKNTVLEGIQDLQTQVANGSISVGQSIGSMGADWAESLNEMAMATGMSVEEMNSMLSSMGVDAEVVTEYVQQKVKVPVYRTEEKVISENPRVTETKTVQSGVDEMDGVIPVAQINMGETGDKPNIKFIGNGNVSSSSTSSAGSKTSDAKAKKSDLVDRYKEINDKIDDSTRTMDRASKAADRLYGPARLKQMEKINKALKEEIGHLKDKRSEAELYLEEDKTALGKALDGMGMGLQFTLDENGNISNYEDVMTQIHNKRESLLKSFGATMDDEEQKRLDNFDNKADELKDAISQYDETRELLEDIDDQIDDKWNEWQDNNYEQLTYKLELKIEINDRDLEEIEYYLNKAADDFYQMAESAALLVQGNSELNPGKSKLDVYSENYETDNAHFNDLTSQYNTFNEDGVRSISQADYVAGLKEIHSNALADAQALKELDDTMLDYYGNTLAMAGEELAKYTDRMEHQTAVLEHYRSIMDIIGKSTDYESMGVILEGQAKTIENELAVAQGNYEMLAGEADYWKQMMDSVDETDPAFAIYKANWEAAESAAREAQDNMLAKTEEWAEAMKAVLENKLAGLAQTLENALTGGTSFDTITTQMERAASLQEEYLTTTNKIYETNKMINTAQQAIDKTTNTVAKQKLKSFQQETAQLQSKKKLSQYELEIQQAKYDLLLAEIALEEAQQAKSTVRLQRDSEGNFGYVYTADANELADAEQKLADAQNNLYNIGLEGANNYVQKYQETMREMYDTLTDIQTRYLNGEFESEEEYHQAMEEAKEYYYQKLQDYSSLYQVSLTTDSRVIKDAWSTDFAGMTQNTESWKTSVNRYVGEVEQAFKQWDQTVQSIKNQTVGKNLDELNTKVGNIVTESNNLTTAITKDGGLLDALQSEITEVGNVALKYASVRGEVQGLILEYEELAEKAKIAYNSIDFEENDDDKDDTPPGVKGTVGGDGDLSDVGGDGDLSDVGVDKDTDGFDDFDNRIEETSTTYLTSDSSPVTVYTNLGRGTSTKIAGNRLYHKGTINPNTTQYSGYTFYEVFYDQAGIAYPGYLLRKDYADLKQKASSFDTGGYTGSWGSEGKMAMLHEKELILNANDTTNFLASLEVLREIVNTINLHSMNAQLGGLLSTPHWTGADQSQILEQQVHIEASFPGVQDRNEIEEAFNNLINRASQFVNRK